MQLTILGIGNYIVCCTSYITCKGKVRVLKNFPYPRQYATINYIFIWVFIILSPFGIMQEFESIGIHLIENWRDHSTQSSLVHRVQRFIATHFIWFSIPFSTLLAWVIHTMDVRGKHTENSFEGGPNDIPITDISRGIEIDIRQLIDDTDISEPYQWASAIIM